LILGVGLPDDSLSRRLGALLDKPIEVGLARFVSVDELIYDLAQHQKDWLIL